MAKEILVELSKLYGKKGIKPDVFGRRPATAREIEEAIIPKPELPAQLPTPSEILWQDRRKMRRIPRDGKR